MLNLIVALWAFIQAHDFRFDLFFALWLSIHVLYFLVLGGLIATCALVAGWGFKIGWDRAGRVSATSR